MMDECNNHNEHPPPDYTPSPYMTMIVVIYDLQAQTVKYENDKNRPVAVSLFA